MLKFFLHLRLQDKKRKKSYDKWIEKWKCERNVKKLAVQFRGRGLKKFKIIFPMMDHRAIRSGGTTREKEGFSKRDLHASPLWIPCDCLWIDEESPSLGRSPYNLAPFLEILLCIQLRIRWIQRCIPISRTASSSSSHSSLPLVKTSFFSFSRNFLPFSRHQWHFSFFFLFFFFIIISTNCETLPVGIHKRTRA